MFKDRFEAGRMLAEKLLEYKNNKSAIILAIPRGGLQIGYEMARLLSLKLDIILTKKIGHPQDPEFAIGAASINSFFLASDWKEYESSEYLKKTVAALQRALQSKYVKYFHGQPFASSKQQNKLKGKIVIITDDGIATGMTMLAAIELARNGGAAKVIVAVPGCHPDIVKQLRQKADDVVCIEQNPLMAAVSQFYEDFPQIEDEEAIRLLSKANE